MDYKLSNEYQQSSVTTIPREWHVCGLRGAITVSQNTAAAITEAVNELMSVLETQNQLNPAKIVSVTFSVTQDLDALFPASVARRRPGWKQVPMIDVQQMQIVNDLEHCIRVLIHSTLTPLCLRMLTPCLSALRHSITTRYNVFKLTFVSINTP